jgi:hypothetical protein
METSVNRRWFSEVEEDSNSALFFEIDKGAVLLCVVTPA